MVRSTATSANTPKIVPITMAVVACLAPLSSWGGPFGVSLGLRVEVGWIPEAVDVGGLCAVVVEAAGKVAVNGAVGEGGTYEGTKEPLGMSYTCNVEFAGPSFPYPYLYQHRT